MILGFSTGCLYKTHDGLDPKTFDVFRRIGCNAIEIMCHDSDLVLKLSKITKKDLVGFEYVSLHAPALGKMTNGKIKEVLVAIESVHKNLNFDSVVIHPDNIADWNIFSEFDIPYAIENMDNRKQSCRNVGDLKEVFKKIDASMVIDVNHCFANDVTMKLAYDLTDAFRERIREIHLSGFETFHEPLFRTQQEEILRAIPDKNLPIIIESGCETIEDAQKEFEYVRKYLLEN